jgi:hypothetical protein
MRWGILHVNKSSSSLYKSQANWQLLMRNVRTLNIKKHLIKETNNYNLWTVTGTRYCD